MLHTTGILSLMMTLRDGTHLMVSENKLAKLHQFKVPPQNWQNQNLSFKLMMRILMVLVSGLLIW
jgi:hypothetical protein